MITAEVTIKAQFYDLDPMTVTVVPDLPMTPTGKIAKSDLVASAKAARQRVA